MVFQRPELQFSFFFLGYCFMSNNQTRTRKVHITENHLTVIGTFFFAANFMLIIQTGILKICFQPLTSSHLFKNKCTRTRCEAPLDEWKSLQPYRAIIFSLWFSCRKSRRVNTSCNPTPAHPLSVCDITGYCRFARTPHPSLTGSHPRRAACSYFLLFFQALRIVKSIVTHC